MRKLFLITFCFIVQVLQITGQNPVLVKDINPNGGSFTDQAFEIGDTTYLVVNDSISGNELWITNLINGTTNLVRDINLGAVSSDPIIIGTTNHKLIFWALDSTGKKNLWSSDGSFTGTIKLNETVTYFGVYGGACQTDSLVFFIPDDSTNGKEIWVTDGTVLGTKLLKDINIGAIGCNPSHLTKFGNKLLFGANDSTHGQEPWISDGSESNTVMLKDISLGQQDSHPNSFIVVGNEFYFGTTGYPGFGNNVFKSNGTDTLTIALGKIPMWIEHLFFCKGELCALGFNVDMFPFNPIRYCVGRFNLFTNTGEVIKDFGNVPNSGILYIPEIIGDSIFYFGFYDQFSGYWYRSDGTDTGTIDLVVPGGFLYTDQLVLYKNMLCFMHQESQNSNFELFIFDGLHMTNKMLDIVEGPSSSYPHKLTVFKDKLYFIAKDSLRGNQLFVTEGDIANTFLLLSDSNCNDNALPPYGGWRLPYTKNHLFFNANYHNIGQELYSLDGSFPLNVQIIKSENQGAFYPNPSSGTFKYLSNPSPIQIEVFNAIGKLILITKMPYLDLATFENGLYFARVHTKNGILVDKLLLNK